MRGDLRPAVLIGIGVDARQGPLREALAETPRRLRAVPPNAAVVSGQACPAVVLARTEARLRGESVDWQQVCPGWRWPHPLRAHLDALRATGRPLVVDLRSRVWVGSRQEACRREAEAYVRSRGPAPTLTVWR